MAMASERTVWAEGMQLSDELIESLTSIAEESERRFGEFRPELDPRDIFGSWPVALDVAGAHDLAQLVRSLDPN